MEKPYFFHTMGSKISGELLRSLQVLQTNNDLKQLVESLAQRCRARVESYPESDNEINTISRRLTRLQSIFHSKNPHKTLTPLEGVVRKLEGGAAVLFIPADPSFGPSLIRHIVQGNCEVEALRIDVTQVDDFPLSLGAETAATKMKGHHLLAAIGLVRLDLKGLIAEENLDGISLWFPENGNCFGTEVMFRGPASNTPHRIFPYNRASHTNHVAKVRKSIAELSFLSTPKT